MGDSFLELLLLQQRQQSVPSFNLIGFVFRLRNMILEQMFKQVTKVSMSEETISKV